MDEVLAILQQTPGTPLVAFTGATCRTWYADRDLLFDVMEIIHETTPFVWVTDGVLPFEHLVEEVAVRMNIEGYRYRDVYLLKPKEKEVPFEEISCQALDGVSLLVVFPREKEPSKGLSPIVSRAMDVGMPVVALSRDGTCTRWN